jgi:large subunit ribosomal protein L16
MKEDREGDSKRRRTGTTMLQPNRQKYRKMHRGRRRGEASRGSTVAFGEFGLQAMQAAWLSSRQIEAARRAITHYIKRGGKIWIRVFPDHPVTHKPAETRMGSGKGAVDHYAAVVKPGRILFEVGGLKEDVAREAIRLAGYKLPIQTRFVVREELGSQAEPGAVLASAPAPAQEGTSEPQS